MREGRSRAEGSEDFERDVRRLGDAGPDRTRATCVSLKSERTEATASSAAVRGDRLSAPPATFGNEFPKGLGVRAAILQPLPTTPATVDRWKACAETLDKARYYSMHVKDISAERRIGIAVGEGNQPWKQIFDLAKAANIHNFDVETGAPADVVMDTLRMRAEFLKNYPAV